MAIGYERNSLSPFSFDGGLEFIDHFSFPSSSGPRSSHGSHARLSASPLMIPSGFDASASYVWLDSAGSEVEFPSPSTGSPESRRQSEPDSMSFGFERHGGRASPAYSSPRPIYEAARGSPAATSPPPPWDDGSMSLSGLSFEPNLAMALDAMVFPVTSSDPSFGTQLVIQGPEPWSPISPRNPGLAPQDSRMLAPVSTSAYDQSLQAWATPHMFSVMAGPVPGQPAMAPKPEVDAPHMVSRQLSNASSFSTGSLLERGPGRDGVSFSQRGSRDGAFGPGDAKPAPRQMATSPVFARQASDAALSPASEAGEVRVKPPPTPSPGPTTGSPESDERLGVEAIFVPVSFPRGGRESHGGAGAPRQRVARRHGGRVHGTHLQSDVAARARHIRDIGTCWICCFQRDSCSPGEICARCIKRNQRANMEHGYILGCDRTRLVTLKTVFIPEWFSHKHDLRRLHELAQAQIRRFRPCVPVSVELLCIFSLPAIRCELYEFEATDRSALRQIRYTCSPETGKFEPSWADVLPLSFLAVEREDVQKYDKWVNQVVDDHLEEFARRYYLDEEDDFLPRLLNLMVRLRPDHKEEVALLREVFRLLVVAHAMGRLKLFPKEYLPFFATKLRGYDPDASYGSRPGSNLVNSQLNYIFLSTFNTTMETVLKRLNQLLRSSKGNAKWTSAFCAILGLAMCVEDVQNTVHIYCRVQCYKKHCTREEAHRRTVDSCQAIDEKFGFLSNLFGLKFHRFNPLRDWKDPNVWGDMSESSREFAKGVADLSTEKWHSFLSGRQHVPVTTEEPEKYYGRLVSRFLCTFWGPRASSQ